MKFSPISVGATVALVLESAFAYPGMGAKFAEIGKRLNKRDDPVGVNIPLGDLAGGPRTAVGKTITQCLDNTIDCYLTDPKVGRRLLKPECNVLTISVDLRRTSVAQFAVHTRHMLRVGMSYLHSPMSSSVTDTCRVGLHPEGPGSALSKL
jgi:hypothetical protein